MRFNEEVVPESEYKFPHADLRGAELKMAQQLIDGLSGEWDPTKYTNEYHQNLMRIIEAKRKHRTPKLEVQHVEADEKVVDLMERLRASLGQAAARKGTSHAHRAASAHHAGSQRRRAASKPKRKHAA
jgi:DNA end-binding protein Ku